MIRNWMTVAVRSISDRSPVSDARGIMREHDIRHLPVLRKGVLVGLVSDRDLRETRPWFARVMGLDRDAVAQLDALEVGVLMTCDPVTIDASATIQGAAQIMLRHRIGCLPVLEDGELVGLLSETDLLRALLECSGSSIDPAG